MLPGFHWGRLIEPPKPTTTSLGHCWNCGRFVCVKRFVYMDASWSSSYRCVCDVEFYYSSRERYGLFHAYDPVLVHLGSPA